MGVYEWGRDVLEGLYDRLLLRSLDLDLDLERVVREEDEDEDGEDVEYL